jgi:hypothetical protein
MGVLVPGMFHTMLLQLAPVGFITFKVNCTVAVLELASVAVTLNG